METVNVNHKFSVWEDIFGGVLQGWNVWQGSILGPRLFNIFINGMFIIYTSCDMCKYTDYNTLYGYNSDLHQVQEYWKEDCQTRELFLWQLDDPCSS